AFLWREHYPAVPARRRLRRQDPQGRQARRSSRRAADQVRAGHQRQDCQGPWPEASAVTPPARGSGDRIVERREFLCAATSGLLAAPLAAEAQQAGKVWRVGFLSPGQPEQDNSFWVALRELLRERGWIEGQNLVVDWRHAEGNFDRLFD